MDSQTRRLPISKQARIVQSLLILLYIAPPPHPPSNSLPISLCPNTNRGMMSALGSMNICQVLLLTLVLFLAMTSNVEPSNRRSVSSCGDIHNISDPFRLKSNPNRRGVSIYDLACEDSHTVVYLLGGRYYVQFINYTAKQIRLVDDGLQKDNFSSLPHHSLLGNWDTYTRHSSNSYYKGSQSNSPSTLVIVNCSKPINSSFYISTSPCIEGSYSSNTSLYWNLYALPNPIASDVRDVCTIHGWTWVSYYFGGEKQINSNSYNYERIHNIMADGFVLDFYSTTWKSGFFCSFDFDSIYRRQVCSSYFFDYEGGFLDELAFLTTIEFGVLLVQFCVVKFVIGMPVVAIFLIYKCRRRHLAMDKNVEEFLQAHNNFLPIRYSYSNIKKITRNFRHKLGEGGYGYVYKGTLRSGNEVAIKILKQSKAHGQDFISEVATIGRIHHVNVVQLVGFCFEGSKQALVYDLMSNGSLDKHIFTDEGVKFLGYRGIYEIALGVARGIEYLHRGCDMQILHFDIKPHNILLDQHFTPKVSDFGLARLYPTDHSIVSLTAARGTLGYMAPELFYKNIGGVSYKADVYSFGMLLMEMAGRRKNINANAEHSSQIYFPLWVYDQVNEGESVELEEVVEEERKVTKKMIIVALWCIQLNPDHRPPMSKVLEMLEGDIGKLQMPPKPLIYPPDEPCNNDKSEMELETFSTSSNGQISYANFPFGGSDDV
ncbi:LEAF RUST 10 DISEASE-RESISTANCE LOCUS RECEPTOR-LIKE PROTEIN KINASE-like 2.8 isoform X2 [Syzygium oleosum]|uniref:LEAF RUST 10 DISEASE-RESISTANCE LOCUS RECEPTOR-LIKE PROTEIN KINASE-like 2.8 isoform X2 n=1 Tax=Syzygium oleosum TaxID=219896 RepID=UPI0024BA213C|nr:LEAF RUST 10 DISEASE-RESISTANCE LOCUS RECEPTOR-LIKE PROTEIN KINASE-like 2.8 isoform X2 [Syzygium oleosum]